MAQNPKVPPHDDTAEKAVLGGVLIDTSAISEVARILQPKHFYQDTHKKIYESILVLFDKSKPIDVVTLSAQLKRDGTLDAIGGKAYLSELLDAVPSSAFVKHYAEIVKNTYIKRSLISTGSYLVEKAFEDGGDVQDLLNSAESEIFALSQAFLHRDFVALRDIVSESFERLETLLKTGKKTRGIPTGFASLDRKLAGFHDSNLVILAARPGVGKTTFALNMAMHMALNEKIPIGFFSLEMSKEELVDRLLVGQADIDAWKLKTGRLDDEDYTKLTQAMGELSEAPIYIDDTPGASVLEMRTKARKMKIEKDLKLIIVDYLQLAVPGKRFDSRTQEVGYISQNLKNLARELKVPVIALSQLSRAIEHRGEKKPQLADLRESGCLVGSTLVTLAETGEQVRVDSLVGKKNFDVWSMTPEMQIIPKNVSKVFATGKKKVFKIMLSSGKTIKATANHKFRVFDGWKRLDELSVGESLAVPENIQQPVDDNVDFSDNHLIMLAHMIGDGCYVKKQPIHYTSNTIEHISIVKQSAQQLFDIESRIVQQDSWYHIYLPSPYKLTHNIHHPFITWMRSQGLNFARSFEKKLPESIYMCSKRQITLFLRHLWSTDGSVHVSGNSARIYYGSTSKQLAVQVQSLLLRVGISARLKESKQQKDGKKYNSMWTVDISGLENQLRFIQEVGGFGNKLTSTQLALKVLQKKKGNPNVGVLDKTAWKKLVYKEKQKVGLSWRDVCRRMGITYGGSSMFKNGISKERLYRLAVALDSNVLLKYAQSDILWDRITSIEESGYEDVYDMTVPGTHNFIANDIVVHNSIEQDADVVMFIYRQEEDDELMDASKRLVKLSVAKHRNGATGEIDLLFRGDRVRFYDVEKSTEL